MASVIKKTLNHPNVNKQKQKQFEKELNLHQQNHKNIVYIDETGFEESNFRLRGYSPIGQNCIAEGSWQKSKRTNAIGALFNGSLFSVGLFECAIDSDCFYSWVVKILLPKLPKKSVLVMDNASFHKRKDIIEAIKNKGHDILWLPPYSPEYNPIEKTWAWLKKLRCQWRLKSIDELFNRFIKQYSTFI